SPGEEVAFLEDVLKWDRMTLQATKFLMAKQPWTFLFTVFIGVDIISHFMWRHMATQGESVPSADPAVKEILANAIQTVYRQVDSIIADLLQSVDDQTYVMLVSD